MSILFQSSFQPIQIHEMSRFKRTRARENNRLMSIDVFKCQFISTHQNSQKCPNEKGYEKGKQKTKTDEKEHQYAEPDVIFLDEAVHQVKQLRGRTISVNPPNQEPISKVTCKKEISAKVVSDEPSSGTVSQINNSKFLETFGGVVPQQYKVSYSHKIPELKNVKKVAVQSSMDTKMHKPNGDIDWGSQAIMDNITERTSKAIARGNELYKMCGLKPPPSSTDGIFTIGSTQAKPLSDITAEVIATTNELCRLSGPDVLGDISKPKTVLKQVKPEKLQLCLS
ncbi:OLC1v1036538C1 [Oldenlandia corymbosa var. corymbosa]|uniref:OLC1v1036538C1 n=1 Tax=Oldenlandia corymbosa var. corymbosa TaxID=529605 RepID=A0AAV1CWV8_OLDCO|nr:OLC1v1036538C1 [Oldenlandia corymbosa var. corymbosa]